MRPEDEVFLTGREERIKLGDRFVIVRELHSAADLPQLANDQNAGYVLLVRSVFEENGEPTFTDDDIPKLRIKSRRRLAPLLAATARVNGVDPETETKNSEAAPTGG
jgi:hypothetical protein